MARDRSSAGPAFGIAVVALMYAGLLFFLRAVNQTGDGLSYAVSIRSGLDMFHPHHMIYVPVARLIHLGTGVDPLTAALVQNLFWTVVLAWAAWRLAGLIFSGRTAPLVATAALLATRGVMIYSVRVETYLPALACLVLATWLASFRRPRYLLLSPVLALAVLYHQTNVLFVVPLLVLMIGHDRRTGFSGRVRGTAITLAGAAVLVTGVYLAGYLLEGQGAGFWAFTLSYARAPIEAWGNFGYFSPGGLGLLAFSQARVILPVREVVAGPGGLGLLAALAFLTVWHLRRLRSNAPFAPLRRFCLVFLAVYLMFFLWWMPGDLDFFLATLLPLWLLVLLLIADLRPGLQPMPLAVGLVLVLAAGNIFFTILPMHRDPGPGRALAAVLDRASPAGAELVTGYFVQQEMLYFTDRKRIHEGDGLARSVLKGEAPWSGTSAAAPVVVIEGPYLRELLARDDAETTEFLRWLVGFDPARESCRAIEGLPGADGILVGSQRRRVLSWPAVVDEIREISRP